MTPDPLLDWRREFPILEHTRYLISNSLGAMAIRYVCAALGGRLGAEIVTVPSPSGDGVSVDEERVCEAIDESTALVAISHVIGTPDVPALYAAREGPRIVRQAGVEAIREKSLRQTDRLCELASERGFRSATPREHRRRRGTACVDFDNALEVSRELNARDVVVDYRPGVGIRMSPHLYTGDDELDAAFAAIDEIREAGAWRRWVDRPAVVT